jgi:hypothetical protein
MFQKISAIAEGINRFLNKTKYVFEIFTWSVDTIRVISGCLANFPKPPADENNDKNSGSERSESVSPDNGEHISEQPLQESSN